LTAAGLGSRDLNRASRFLEQLHGGKSHCRPKQIHQTCHEQRYAHPVRRLQRAAN
jgi:hypothetical protein